MVRETLAPVFDEYKDKYDHLRMNRQSGVLELRIHSEGRSCRWNARVHEELGFAFIEIGLDPENKVLIVTGEGEDFCAELDMTGFPPFTPRAIGQICHEGQRLMESLLNIDIPVIGAVNGRAWVHAELALLSNIVLASSASSFRDIAHFSLGVVPGDGVHVVWPALLGPTRASYFLLTGQTIPAREAQDLGLINEILPADGLLPRAHALAEEMLTRPPMARRYARMLLTHNFRRRMGEQLGHGLALEGLAMLDREESGIDNQAIIRPRGDQP
jgi:enoyl-CoA hydratase/carnithine racemase